MTFNVEQLAKAIYESVPEGNGSTRYPAPVPWEQLEQQYPYAYKRAIKQAETAIKHIYEELKG